jgi:pilus assembly protein CpaB
MAIYSSDEGISKAVPRRVEAPGRKIRLRALVFMVIALGSGLVAAYLITFYLSRHSAQAVRIPVVSVVVAAIDLPLATTLKQERLAYIDWPAGTVPAGAYSDGKLLDGRVTSTALVKGELVVESRLATPGGGQGMAAMVPPNMRVMAVKVNDVSGLFGWLHPGDSVDVITTMIEPALRIGGEQQVRSKIVLQNITVKAVGEELVTQNAKPVKVPVVMLLVTPDQSEKLALASSHGDLQLTMRSGIDHEEVVTPGISPSELLAGGEREEPKPLAMTGEAPPARHHEHRSAARTAAVAQVDSTPRKPLEAEVVEVLRGDRLERRRVPAKEQP